MAPNVAPWHNDSGIQTRLRERYINSDLPYLKKKLEDNGMEEHLPLFEHLYDSRKAIRQVRHLVLSPDTNLQDKLAYSQGAALVASQLGDALLTFPFSETKQQEFLMSLEQLKASVGNSEQYMVYDTTPIYEWMSAYMLNFKNGIDTSVDDLGEQFRSFTGPQDFLEGISISDLRHRVSQHPDSRIVVASAPSSGVLEGGMVSAFLNKIGIPSLLTPVFVDHDDQETYFLDSTSIQPHDIVIAHDDPVNQATGITMKHLIHAVDTTLPGQRLVR